MQETEFEIDRDAVWKYFVVNGVLKDIGFATIFLFWIVFFMAAAWGLLGFIAACFLFSALCVLITLFELWLCPLQAKNLRYRLEGNTLRADSGVFFFSRQSIPLERITDINLVQGPVQRFFGIWAMRIQTAGSAQCEATLYGVREPEKVREQILAQRKNVYGEKSDDA